MALPTQEEIITLDYAYKGKPFVWISTTSEIDTTKLDYAYRGRPVITTSPTVVDSGVQRQMFLIF